MSGTKLGGLKCAETNRKKYGKDWYAKIGAKGGKNGHTGGFAANPTLARLAGALGGRRSKRGKSIACSQRTAKAKELRAEGKKITEIADILGVTPGTVSKYLITD